MIDALEFLKKQEAKKETRSQEELEEIESLLSSSSKLIISDIKAQKKSRDRYSIFVNGKFLMGVFDEIVLDYKLSKGSNLSYDLINEILYEDLKKKAIRKALSLLSYKQRTAKELSSKLRDKEYDENIIYITIERLKELAYIDDEQYAMDYVEMRKGFSGAYKIKNELYRKGIDSDIIERAISTIDPEDQYEELRDMCLKKYRQSEGLSNEKKYNRTMSYLIRKGYNFSEVKRVMDELDIKKY